MKMIRAEPAPHRRRTSAVGLLVWLAIATAFGLAMLVRYRLIEPVAIAQACDAGLHDWACSVRWLAIRTFDHQQLGYIAIAGCVLAILMRSAFLAWLTAVVSVTGLIWYCFEPCAVGLVVSVLLLARAQRGRPDRYAESDTQDPPHDRVAVADSFHEHNHDG